MRSVILYIVKMRLSARFLIVVIILSVLFPQIVSAKQKTDSIADCDKQTIEYHIYKFEDEALKVASKGNRQSLVASANNLLLSFAEEGLTDEVITLRDAAPRDSVVMIAAYWTAEYYYAADRYPESIRFAEMSAPLAEKMLAENDDKTNRDLSELLSDTYHLIGLCYYRLADFDRAAAAFNKTYQIDKSAGDPSRLSSTLNSIAGVYVANRQPELAERYILEAISVNSAVDEPLRMATLLGTAAEVYHLMGDEQNALMYSKQALEIAEQQNKTKQGKHLSQMAAAYIGLGQNAEAVKSLQRAIPLLRETGSHHSMAICYRQLGDVYFAEKDMQQAAQHYQAAADMFREQGDMYGEMNAVKGLYNALRGEQPQEAMSALERYNILKDSVYTSETTNAINRYNAEYARDSAERTQQQENDTMSLYVINSIIGLLLLLSLIAFFIWRMHSRHHRQEKQMREAIDVYKQQNEQLNVLYKNAVAAEAEPESSLSKEDREWLDRLQQIVDDQMERGVVSVDSIADTLRITPSQLRVRLSQLLDTTPREYILQARIEKACHLLLAQRELQVAEVAMRCGYDEPSNFIHAFRRYCGMSPLEYRKQKLQKNKSDN